MSRKVGRDFFARIKKLFSPNQKTDMCLVATINTKVVGVTKYTTRGTIVNRQEILMNMRSDDKLFLQRYDNNGSNSIRVVLKRNFADIGNLDAELAVEICEKYYNHTIKITHWKITCDGKYYGCDITLEIYK